MKSASGGSNPSLQGHRWEVYNTTSFVNWSGNGDITLYLNAASKRVFIKDVSNYIYTAPSDYRGILEYHGIPDTSTYDTATTSGTTTSLTVSGKSWTTDQLKGQYLTFTGGGVTGSRIITGNTSDTISWSEPLGAAVANGQQFIIRDIVILTLTDSQRKYVFAGQSALWTSERSGMLVWEQDAYGDRNSYAYTTLGSVKRILSITTAQGWSVTYSYVQDDQNPNIGRIDSLEVKNGSNQVLQRAHYTYFTAGAGYSDNCGTDGDLIMVQVFNRASGDNLAQSGDAYFSIQRTTQYRYYRNGDDVDGDGNADSSYTDADHRVKFVLENDQIQQILTAPDHVCSTPSDILALDDTAHVDGPGGSGPAIKTYASRSFTYYVSNLDTSSSLDTAWTVGQNTENLGTKFGGSNFDETGYAKSETVNGSCASCGGGGGRTGITRTYYYMDLHTGLTQYQVHMVSRLIVEDAADSGGAVINRTVYGLNQDGVSLRRLRAVNPASPQYWCTSTVVDDLTKGGGESDQDWANRKLGRNQPLQMRMPSAHTAITGDAAVLKFLDPTTNTNDTDTVSSESGLIYVYTLVKGRQTEVKVRNGTGNPAYYVSATDYGDGNTIPDRLPVTIYRYPMQTTTKGDGFQITYSYTFWDGAKTQLKTQSVIYPVVDNEQNGSEAADTTKEYYDQKGQLRWSKDQNGRITYYSYQENTGGLAYVMRDVKTDDLSDELLDGSEGKWVAWDDGNQGQTIPTGFTYTGSDAMQIVSKTEYDSQGRVTTTIVPNGIDVGDVLITYTVYMNTESRIYPAWDSSTHKPRLPVSVTIVDDGNRVVDSYAVDPTNVTFSTIPDGTETLPPTARVSWTHVTYDTHGRLESEDTYHTIPSNGAGSSGANYYRTIYAYDNVGRPYRMVASDGTITWREFDALGRDKETWIGTNSDTATPGNPTAGSSNLKRVSGNFYDGATSGTLVVGDGNMTETRVYFDGPSSETYYSTQNRYDWRNRLVRTRGPNNRGSRHVLDQDTNGKTTEDTCYWSSDNNFDSDTRTLQARTENYIDPKGQIFKTVTYEVDGDGNAQHSLTALAWFDPTGRPIKTRDANNLFRKTAYDGIGRTTATYIGYQVDQQGALDEADTDYSAAQSVSGDTVIEQTTTSYDLAGHPLTVTSYQRWADGTGTGSLLSSNARITYFALWYDAAGRMTHTADYGTNGGSAFEHPGSPAEPSGSTTVIVTRTEYDGAGRGWKKTDNGQHIAVTLFDALGRTTKTIENADNSNPPTSLPRDPAETDTDQQRTTVYGYDSVGHMATLTAKNSKGLGNGVESQTTTYVYGTAVGGISPAVYRNDLLRAVIYPDSDDPTDLSGNGNDSTYDRVEYKYNRLGRRIWMKDQRTLVHEYEYATNGANAAGELTIDKVTTLPGGVDPTVKRIERAFDTRGRVTTIGSYDAASSGNLVNEVTFTYNDSAGGWGSLSSFEQDNTGSASATVSFAYADGNVSGVAKYLRLTSLTYPGPTGDERVVFFNYPSPGAGNGAVLSRLDNIATDSNGTSKYALYTYLGTGIITKVEHPGVSSGTNHGLTLNYDPEGDHTYAGWDQFSRVKDQKWIVTTDGTPGTVDRYTYGYNASRNRIYRSNEQSVTRSEFYTYDGLNRLQGTKRGTLNGGKTDVETENLTFRQLWGHLDQGSEVTGLDTLGNWAKFKQDDDGNSTWDLQQTREHNLTNEITDITGGSWIEPVYDTVGNMIEAPSALSPTSRHKLIYDAWNRLAKVTDNSDVTIALYRYDGLNHRIRKLKNNGASSWDVTEYYYNPGWQVLEECKALSVSWNGTGDDPSPSTHTYAQYVWDTRYIDAPVCRFRDYDGFAAESPDDELEETLYYCIDANMNVTALLRPSDGAVVERYVYDPYGKPTILAGTKDVGGTTTTDWGTPAIQAANDIRYCGYRYDPETALYHVRNRMYHSDIGRWSQRDPIGFAGGLNSYEYVFSMPLTFFDPLGLQACSAYRESWGGPPRPLPFSFLPAGIKLEYSEDVVIEGRRCETCCANGQPGYTATGSYTVKGKVKGTGPEFPFQLPFPVPPIMIQIFAGVEGGYSATMSYDSCTKTTEANGCGYIRVSVGVESCEEFPFTGTKACISIQGYARKTWCVNKPGQWCGGGRVGYKVCLLWRCKEGIFIDVNNCGGGGDSGGGD